MSTRPCLWILALVAVLVPGVVSSQQSRPADTTRVTMAAPAVKVRRAMVIGLASDTTVSITDPRFTATRAVAESLGFGFGVVSTTDLRVVDARYEAVYSLPEDVRDGYFIIVPGRRPDLVRGYVGPDSLRQRIASYLRHTVPLATH